jgi:hypothetical protein
VVNENTLPTAGPFISTENASSRRLGATSDRMSHVETISLLPLVSTDGRIGQPVHAPVGIRLQFPGAGAV